MIRSLDSILPRSRWHQFLYRLKQIITYPESLSSYHIAEQQENHSDV